MMVYKHMGMRRQCISFFAAVFLFLVAAAGRAVPSTDTAGFDENYYVEWGNDHVLSLNQGREIQLSMDKSSGSGFGSKQRYGSGFFEMRIKLLGNDSAGVVTTFYLTSHEGKHDEVDLEFLGNREGKPIALQTNVFSNGQGNREQRILLWFDPTADFHSYKLLWNQHHIVFYVDDTPIRVFKNNTEIGVKYPSQPMQIEASLWNGDSWATDGGQTKTNWSFAPFKAHYRGFDVHGCVGAAANCHSSSFWWNDVKYWQLDESQQKAYDVVKRKYMNYDYCKDTRRYPNPPPECLVA
ncbi:xyloglucan endotransglucosylase/hydrolase protein 2-like [Diospyros lotus]|uniref:xyloglucan endotransglucosylase/hydrolase protein 2-like n=1 Tax=Diospyros lotus TaxID=55363 RepID=UPI002255AA64|nr:xyloglucan endotransglucosylase/hydrolase protein 2-like [Diospyros lotus]